MLTEQEINEAHAARWAEATTKYGSKFDVPRQVVSELGEQLRLAWCSFYEARNGGDESRPRRDKTKRMTEFLKANVGKQITAEELAEATQASNGTAYAFISDHRSAFRKDGRGRYTILDVGAERAAARTAPVAPVVHAAASDALAAATNDIAIATAAVARMAGESAPIRTVGKA